MAKIKLLVVVIGLALAGCAHSKAAAKPAADTKATTGHEEMKEGGGEGADGDGDGQGKGEDHDGDEKNEAGENAK